MVAGLVGASESASAEELKDRVTRKLGLEGDRAKADRIFSGIQRLGLLSSSGQVAPRGKLIDSLCAHLERELAFKEGERDLVILHHDFLVQRRSGRRENLTSTLISYGTPGGYTAMAKTVGLPAAFGAQLILEGRLKTPGVLVPTTKDIYLPLLEKLEARGIAFVEKVVSVD